MNIFNSRIFGLAQVVSIATTMLLLSTAVSAAPTRGDIVYRTSLNIQVIEDEAERKQLLAQAEKLGGYFISNATGSIELRLPADKLLVFLDFIRAHWRVYGQDYNTQDVSSELLEKQTALEVKTDLLKRYQAMLAKTEKSQFFKVTRAADDLIREIEMIKGRISYLKRSVQFALVTLKLAEPTRMETKQASSFEWINQTGLPQLWQSFYSY